MQLQDVCVRNDDIAAMQFFSHAKKDGNDYFDIILKSGVTLHVDGDKEIYSKVVEQLGIK